MAVGRARTNGECEGPRSSADRQSPPVCLRRALDTQHLAAAVPWDRSVVLGSFWPNSSASFESSLIKTLKECYPAGDYQPHISGLCRFYAQIALRAVEGERFDWAARVLSSAERERDPARPMSLIVDRLCALTGARDVTDVFFKAETRPPMRSIDRLAGPDALAARLDYVIQDLFVRPRPLGGTVMLVDDICNVGASMRVYAHALRVFAGVERVVCVNLAATRFNRGRDGRGMLKLDTSALAGERAFGEVWTDAGGVLHLDRTCPAAVGRPVCGPRFAAERRASACTVCARAERPRRLFSLWESRG